MENYCIRSRAFVILYCAWREVCSVICASLLYCGIINEWVIGKRNGGLFLAGAEKRADGPIRDRNTLRNTAAVKRAWLIDSEKNIFLKFISTQTNNVCGPAKHPSGFSNAFQTASLFRASPFSMATLLSSTYSVLLMLSPLTASGALESATEKPLVHSSPHALRCSALWKNALEQPALMH